MFGHFLHVGELGTLIYGAKMWKRATVTAPTTKIAAICRAMRAPAPLRAVRRRPLSRHNFAGNSVVLTEALDTVIYATFERPRPWAAHACLGVRYAQHRLPAAPRRSSRGRPPLEANAEVRDDARAAVPRLGEFSGFWVLGSADLAVQLFAVVAQLFS